MFIILKNAKKYSSTRTRALGTRTRALGTRTRLYYPVLEFVLDNFKSCVFVLVLEACVLDSSTNYNQQQVQHDFKMRFVTIRIIAILILWQCCCILHHSLLYYFLFTIL